jgi:hypothetical protein
MVNWCRRRESNSRPSVYKTAALPLCYAGATTDAVSLFRRSMDLPLLGRRAERRQPFADPDISDRGLAVFALASHMCGTSRTGRVETMPKQDRPPAEERLGGATGTAVEQLARDQFEAKGRPPRSGPRSTKRPTAPVAEHGHASGEPRGVADPRKE